MGSVIYQGPTWCRFPYNMRSRISDVCLQMEGVLELYEERLREFMVGAENYRGAEVGLAFGIGEEGSEKGNGILLYAVTLG